MKKGLIILIAVLLVVCAGGYGYYLYNQHQIAIEKAKQEAIAKDIKKYDNIVNSFYNDSQKVNDSANSILDDYSRMWNLGLGFSNMFDLVNASKNINADNANQAKSTLQDTAGDLKMIATAANKYPNKFSDIYDECKKVYSINSDLMSQVDNPTGSYITFNQSVNDLNTQYNSEKSILETLLP